MKTFNREAHLKTLETQLKSATAKLKQAQADVDFFEKSLSIAKEYMPESSAETVLKVEIPIEGLKSNSK